MSSEPLETAARLHFQHGENLLTRAEALIGGCHPDDLLVHRQNGAVMLATLATAHFTAAIALQNRARI